MRNWDQLLVLTSRQNPKLKELFASTKASQATKRGLILAEGSRQIATSLEVAKPLGLFFRDDKQGEACWKNLQEGIDQQLAELCFRVESGLFNSLTATKSSQGVMALFQAPQLLNLSELPVTNRPERFLILDSCQDPGNLGTMIRTVEGLGFDAMILLGDTVWPYNPKVLRAAMGSGLALPLFKVASVRDLAAFKARRPQLDFLAGDLGGEKLYQAPVGKQGRGFALILGNEAHGISPDIKELVDLSLSIPIQGEAESYNLAISCGIMAWYLSELYNFLL
ncbi:MAG: RNA methyltransferase [Eubacteriales bacterium]|nr:RNA methyltransferase [Eubacteriales bacterium]